ncbi:MAG: hypothetical protein CMF58_02225 [Lentimicrobiaceae bacterium]|nr:hypothetical protein [Lentimicrobiaceae bacterium]|tara:strand:- start:53 stop:829 length:777 start_codon:yes stop_codon:yes gene_type:complete
MNKGELDEILCILKLIKMRENKTLFFSKEINSIKSNGIELIDLPKNINIDRLKDENEIIQVAKSCNLKKSPAGSKADVHINELGYSIKSNRSAPPAIVNHTSRPGFVNVCKRIGVNIGPLDNIIKDYWQKRNEGEFGEDIKNSDKKSPFVNHLEYMRPIINYFLFDGTGQKNSYYPSEGIIVFENPLNSNEWNLYNKTNALDFFWHKLVFSLRSKKGMPIGYPDKMSKKAMLQKSSIDKWTEYIDSDFRGALHIRTTK